MIRETAYLLFEIITRFKLTYTIVRERAHKTYIICRRIMKT